MGYSYDYSYSGGEDFLLVFLGIYAMVWGVIMLFGIAMYVIRSLAVYTIAKRRGLENPWLSWLPVGHEWILGSLSDQYKYITRKKVQSRRKVLLGLGIASLICGLLVGGAMVSTMVIIVMEERVGASFLLTMLLSFVSFVLGIVTLVFSYMCKYDIYKSCDPKNAVAYLVISIFINVTEPFFLLACRNKDLGMIPEEPETPAAAAPKAETPAEEPAEAVSAEPEALPGGTPAALPAAEEIVEEAADGVIELPAGPVVTEDTDEEPTIEE